MIYYICVLDLCIVSMCRVYVFRLQLISARWFSNQFIHVPRGCFIVATEIMVWKKKNGMAYSNQISVAIWDSSGMHLDERGICMDE